MESAPQTTPLSALSFQTSLAHVQDPVASMSDPSPRDPGMLRMVTANVRLTDFLGPFLADGHVLHEAGPLFQPAKQAR